MYIIILFVILSHFLQIFAIFLVIFRLHNLQNVIKLGADKENFIKCNFFRGIKNEM